MRERRGRARGEAGSSGSSADSIGGAMTRWRSRSASLVSAISCSARRRARRASSAAIAAARASRRACSAFSSAAWRSRRSCSAFWASACLASSACSALSLLASVVLVRGEGFGAIGFGAGFGICSGGGPPSSSGISSCAWAAGSEQNIAAASAAIARCLAMLAGCFAAAERGMNDLLATRASRRRVSVSGSPSSARATRPRSCKSCSRRC